jgi:hypothetical protein
VLPSSDRYGLSSRISYKRLTSFTGSANEFSLSPRYLLPKEGNPFGFRNVYYLLEYHTTDEMSKPRVIPCALPHVTTVQLVNRCLVRVTHFDIQSTELFPQGVFTCSIEFNLMLSSR